MVARLLKRIVISGYTDPYHLGSIMNDAARELGWESLLCNAGAAKQTSRLELRLNWRLRAHRPPRLNTYSQHLLEVCRDFRPQFVLVTGITAPNATAVRELRDMGIVCMNYLTDDPWNPSHYAPWFFEALRQYDAVFSPRRANLEQLRNLGCGAFYLPFAYAPELYFPEVPPDEMRTRFDCDVLFYGGADQDRLPYIEALVDAGLNVHLYGGYWERYPRFRHAFRGTADTQTLRWAISGARVTLCLVRRANRDGHVMRTFEASAMGACMLAEDTEEHRAIFGEDGEAVVYFQSVEDVVEKARQLLVSAAERERLAKNVYERIVGGENTYQDRLCTMIDTLQTER